MCYPISQNQLRNLHNNYNDNVINFCNYNYTVIVAVKIIITTYQV